MICSSCPRTARRGTDLCLKCFVARRTRGTPPRFKGPYRPKLQLVERMKARPYDKKCPPEHRQRIHVKASGKWHHATYATGDDPSFFLWVAGGWIEIGLEIEAWRIRQDFDAPSPADYRKRWPWWLRVDAEQRQVETSLKRDREGHAPLDEWAACDAGGPGQRRRSGGESPRWIPRGSGCVRCGGQCPRRAASAS